MNDLQIFRNEEFGEVRTVQKEDGIWFVAKDVAEALGYRDTPDAVRNHVDSEDKIQVKVGEIPTLKTSNYGAVLINESGLYSLVLSSKLPSAKKFKRWVTREVLPSIRKTGSYNLPTTYKDALKQLIIQVEENERLALENDEMKPKAEFFDTVSESKSAISMNEVAKVLDMGIGRNKLFEFLRENKVLDRWNVPYQRYIDNGWFRVIEQKYQKNGEPIVTTKTLVYQKGVDGIRKMYNKLALSYTE